MHLGTRFLLWAKLSPTKACGEKEWGVCFFAGEHTDLGFAGFMEGAVRSAHGAADAACGL